MKVRYRAATVIAATLMALAPLYAAEPKPASAEEHDHNHADAPDSATKAKAAPEASDDRGQMMKRMQEMHKKMMNAKTPEERQALSDEHMKLMQEGMGMMKGMGKQSGPRAMQKRMDMMEMMMQMMMDREMMESGPMKK